MPSIRFVLIVFASVLMGLLITFRVMFHDNDNLINQKRMKSTLARITFNNDSTSVITTRFLIPDNVRNLKDIESITNDIKVSKKLSIENETIRSTILDRDFGGHGFDVSTHKLNEKLFMSTPKDPKVHSRSKRQVP